MSTHLPGFQSFFTFFLHHIELAKLATSSLRVKPVAHSLSCMQQFVGHGQEIYLSLPAKQVTTSEHFLGG